MDGDNLTPSNRKRGGRPPVSDASRRAQQISCRLTSSEVSKLDKVRGKMRRGECLRRLAFHSLPAPVPEVNVELWRELANTLVNLNRAMHLVNAGLLTGRHHDLDAALIEQAIEQVDALRAELLGAEWEDTREGDT